MPWNLRDEIVAQLAYARDWGARFVVAIPELEVIAVKVVLFCGGLGLRMSDGSGSIPKPMVPIGNRPILWHIMKYYAHFGHKDFIVCLGHRAEAIKDFFLNYNEALSNDFVLSEGGKRIELIRSDIDDWRITFVDTGLHSNIGQRLCAVRRVPRRRRVLPRHLRRRPHGCAASRMS